MSAIPRLRFTTHLPIDGTRVGLTVWWGSVPRGWTGKTLRPSMWRATWKLSGEPGRSAR